MKPTTRAVASFALAVLVGVTAGCADPRVPAQRAISNVADAIAAAGPDAALYAPVELRAAAGHLAELRTRFDQQDFEGVTTAAPPVLAEARGLVTAIANGRAHARTAGRIALRGEWSRLATRVPADLAGLRNRLGDLGRAHRPAAGIRRASLAGATLAIDDAEAQWNAANLAERDDDITAAVTRARLAEERLAAARAALGQPAG